MSHYVDKITSEYLPKIVQYNYQPPPEIEGTPVEFRLIYQGPLGSGTESRKDQKNDIRRVFHHQMAELWNQHAGLRALSEPDTVNPRHKKKPQLQILNDHGHQYNFLYLIGDGHGLSCSLDVLFLRRESAGGLVKHGGDIDNRMKVLFDALRMPHETKELPDTPPNADENPFFCVLQDDKYIDKVTVTMDRLLSPVDPRIQESINDVLLIINVKTLLFDFKKADWWTMTDR